MQRSSFKLKFLQSFNLLNKMLRPVANRILSWSSSLKAARILKGFEARNGQYLTGVSTPTFYQRLFCTAEKTDDATKITEEDGELSELDKKMKLIEEKDGIIKDLEDKYKRALAESENTKIRMMKQVDETKLFGIQGFAKDLLEVADILEKATDSVPAEELDQNSHLKTLYEGLVMTDKQLHKVFNKNGVQKLDPIDEKFDPNFHEALFEQVVPGKEGNVVLVNQVGYTLNMRVLRPAKVGVAKAK